MTRDVVAIVLEPDVASAFKTYYSTVEISATTDPNLVFNLRAKLDAAGHYDASKSNVVEVELKSGAKQSELVGAVEPVRDRLMKRYKAAQDALRAARDKQDIAAVAVANDDLSALILFKSDMVAFVRLYTFLSQIFDYGNTDIEEQFASSPDLEGGVAERDYRRAGRPHHDEHAGAQLAFSARGHAGHPAQPARRCGKRCAIGRRRSRLLC